MSLCDELLCRYIVDVLGFSQYLYRTELVEDMVLAHGQSLTVKTIKSWFPLTEEQELQLTMILHPSLQAPASEEKTQIMDVDDNEAETAETEAKTVILQLAA